MWCRCDVTNTDVPCARCPAARSVPAKEVAFLVDQRTERKLYISGIDRKTTEENIQRQKRGMGKKQLDNKGVQQSSEAKQLSDMDADVEENSEISEMDGVEEAGACYSDSLSSDESQIRIRWKDEEGCQECGKTWKSAHLFPVWATRSFEGAVLSNQHGFG